MPCDELKKQLEAANKRIAELEEIVKKYEQYVLRSTEIMAQVMVGLDNANAKAEGILHG